MFIEDTLRQYKKKRAFVNTTNARIELWQKILDDPDITKYRFYICGKEIGMPNTRNNSSPTENEAISNDMNDTLSRALVKEWLEEDKSRLLFPEAEIQQLEMAIESLTEPEKFIIECKYFNNWFWRQIEYSYNDKFRQGNGITEERLKRINMEIIDKLDEMIKPFYDKVQINKDYTKDT
jgi:hypothetical protein